MTPRDAHAQVATIRARYEATLAAMPPATSRETQLARTCCEVGQTAAAALDMVTLFAWKFRDNVDRFSREDRARIMALTRKWDLARPALLEQLERGLRELPDGSPSGSSADA